MGQIVLSGNLQGGPPAGGDTFPSAEFRTALKLSSSPKGFQQATGILTRLFTDPATFVAIGSIPADVPRVNFLYIRCDGNFQLRLTQDDGSGGDVVYTMQCRGLFLSEFPDANFVKLVEIAASGKIEYLASSAS